MKIKTLVAMAITGLFTASLAYAAPGGQKFADESMDDSQQMQTPNSNVGSTQDNTSSQENFNGATDNQGTPDTGSNPDEGNADTATGDEDY